MNIAPILRQGLFGYIDEQDKPRGLLGPDEEQAPAGNGLLVENRGEGPPLDRVQQDGLTREILRLSVERAMQLNAVRQEAANFFGHILTNPMGIRPLTKDPVTGEMFLSRHLQNLGDRVSAVTQGLPGPPGMRPPSPTASAPVTAFPRPGLLFPWVPSQSGVNSENRADAVKHTGDEDFGPVWETDTWDEAVDLLKREQRGEVRGQLRHDDIGRIAMPWGKTGTGASDGFGLSKQLRFHPESVSDLPATIGGMKIVTSTPDRYRLESQTHYAVVSRNYLGRDREPWVLTAYQRK